MSKGDRERDRGGRDDHRRRRRRSSSDRDRRHKRRSSSRDRRNRDERNRGDRRRRRDRSSSRHSRHSRRRYKRLSKSRTGPSKSKSPEHIKSDNPVDTGGIKINLKPLVLASDDLKAKEQDLKYIEGNTFVQNSFKSSRETIETINPLTNPGGLSFVQSGSNTYKRIMQEKAHEEAIFGKLDVSESESLVCRLSLANTPGDSGFTSSIDKIKTIVSPMLNADQNKAWAEWKDRLLDLKRQNEAIVK